MIRQQLDFARSGGLKEGIDGLKRVILDLNAVVTRVSQICLKKKPYTNHATHNVAGLPYESVNFEPKRKCPSARLCIFFPSQSWAISSGYSLILSWSIKRPNPEVVIFSLLWSKQ